MSAIMLLPDEESEMAGHFISYIPKCRNLGPSVN